MPGRPAASEGNEMAMSTTTGSLGLLDYSMGNLHSVQKSFERLGAPCQRLAHGNDLNRWMADGGEALVLPGVGAFDAAMGQLAERRLIQPIRAWVEAGRPLLGICLGLQLLFDCSEEGQLPGLGLVPGTVEALRPRPGYPIPHMGWAPLIEAGASQLFPANTPTGRWVYFVHSYVAVPRDPAVITARVIYADQAITAVVQHGAAVATQFHPEKSGPCGQRMLARWLQQLAA